VRTLLAHSLCLVVAASLGVSLGVFAASVPSPIGNLSDYGAVFDRHGRDEVNASIAEITKLLRIDVYVLLSWEAAYPTVEQFADAVFGAWNLTPRRAILAVFLRVGTEWTASVVASSSVRSELGGIEQRLELRMRDLVDHRRIEEAVRALFGELRGLPAAVRANAALAKQKPAAAGGGLPIAVAVGAPLAGVAVLAFIIHRRVCPRCAGILRVERSSYRTVRRSHSVYSCRRCGYRRGR
jgi:predicted RNA-binding Zn-ribbon protein involved in translation (DUF1610 family)